MTALILYVLLWLWDNRTFDSITKANQRKIDAEEAYHNKQYAKSAALYNQITYGSLFSEPAARLNLAHSLYLSRDYKQAFKHYRLLSNITDNAIASVANSQMALILVAEKDTAGALNQLRTALLLEPGNQPARQNYIVLKKNFSGQESASDIKTNKKKSSQNTQQEQEQPTQPLPTPEGRELTNDDRKEELLKSLKEMNMSEDQARAILDAMKSNESQYIYQLRRKQYKGQPRKTDEIEW